MPTYTIYIKKTETVEKTQTEWKKIADSGNTKDSGAVYEYVPHSVEDQCETIVYRQEIHGDVFDVILPDIVKAVNGLL